MCQLLFYIIFLSKILLLPFAYHHFIPSLYFVFLEFVFAALWMLRGNERTAATAAATVDHYMHRLNAFPEHRRPIAGLVRSVFGQDSRPDNEAETNGPPIWFLFLCVHFVSHKRSQHHEPDSTSIAAQNKKLPPPSLLSIAVPNEQNDDRKLLLSFRVCVCWFFFLLLGVSLSIFLGSLRSIICIKNYNEDDL